MTNKRLLGFLVVSGVVLFAVSATVSRFPGQLHDSGESDVPQLEFLAPPKVSASPASCGYHALLLSPVLMNKSVEPIELWCSLDGDGSGVSMWEIKEKLVNLGVHVLPLRLNSKLLFKLDKPAVLWIRGGVSSLYPENH